MLVNFFCLFYLMVLTETYTISKNIASNNNNNDVYDNVRDIELNGGKKYLHTHHTCRSDTKHAATTPDKSHQSIPTLKTTNLVSKVPENENENNGFFRKIKNKFIKKQKSKANQGKNEKINAHHENNDDQNFKITEKNKYEKLNSNKLVTTGNSVLNKDLDAIDRYLKRKRSYGELVSAKNNVDVNFNENQLNAAARDMKSIKILKFDKAEENSDFNEMKKQLSHVTTKIGHLKNLYSLDKLKGTTPYSTKIKTYSFDFGEEGFNEIVQMENLLNKMKNQAFQTVIEQNPEITEAVTNAVTEITFESDLDDSDLNFRSPISLESINDVEKLNRNNREVLTPVNTLFNNKTEEANNIEKRSVKEETTKGNCVENKVQSKFKKLSNDLNKGIKKIKSTLHRKNPKSAATPPSDKKENRDNKLKTPSEKSPVKIIPNKEITPKAPYKTLKLRSLPSFHFTTPYDDDLAMLTISEKTLSKIRENTLREMLSTTMQMGFNPRYNELDFDEDSVKVSEEDIPDIVMSYNDALDENSVTANSEAEEAEKATSFEGLSNKISYNEFVNGYKHYLKFQKEFGNEKFSNRVRFQAHLHHKVDDIGKFILNKIPEISTARYKRKFFDDTDADDHDLSTKSDESWFKKHFYFFLDSGQPKKYHTAQTVTVKSPADTTARMVKKSNIKLEGNSNLKMDGAQERNDEQVPEAQVQKFAKTSPDSNYLSSTSSFLQTGMETNTESHGSLNRKLKRRLKYTGNRNSKARYKRRGPAEVLKIDNDYNRKKVGFVQADSSPTQTAVVKLENAAKTSKMKSFLNGIRFRKRKKINKIEKSRTKRHNERVRRFNFLKMLKNSLAIGSNNNTENGNKETAAASRDFNVPIRHIDTYSPVPLNRERVSPFDAVKKELRHQVPNITVSSNDLTDSKLVISEAMRGVDFATNKYSLSHIESKLHGYKYTPDITSPINDFNIGNHDFNVVKNNFGTVKDVFNGVKGDFNEVKDDFNGIKDFNGVKDDFNGVKDDFNVAKDDFNVAKEDFNIDKNEFNKVKNFDVPRNDFKVATDHFNAVKNDFKVVKDDSKIARHDFNVVKEVNIKLIKVLDNSTPNKLVATTASYFNDLSDKVNEIKPLTVKGDYNDYLQNALRFDSTIKHKYKTTEEDYIEGNPVMKNKVDKRANRTAINGYNVYETSTVSLDHDEMFNNFNKLTSAATNKFNMEELFNQKSTANMFNKHHNDELLYTKTTLNLFDKNYNDELFDKKSAESLFNKDYNDELLIKKLTPKLKFQFNNDRGFDRLQEKSTLKGFDDNEFLWKEFNQKTSTLSTNDISDDNLMEWYKKSTAENVNEIKSDELFDKFNEDSTVTATSCQNSEAPGDTTLSTIADYFNDLVIWNNDILESKKIGSHDLLKNVSTFIKSYTKSDLNLDKNRYLEVDKFMKTSVYPDKNLFIAETKTLHKKPEYNIKIDDTNIFREKISDLKSKNVNDGHLNRNVQSNVVIEYLNKLNQSKERHEGAKTLTDSYTTSRPFDNYENSKGTDITDLLIDKTLMSYDDEMDYFTSKIKKDIPKKTDNKHSKWKGTSSAKAGKKNTPPKQYYSTPMPMDNKVFEKFLKENQMDVATVTRPLADVTKISKLWMSSKRTSTAKPGKKNEWANKQEKSQKDSSVSKELQSKIEFKPDYEMQYLSEMENSLNNEFDFEDETNGRFNLNDAPIDDFEREVRIVKRGLNFFSKKTTTPKEDVKSKNKKPVTESPVITHHSNDDVEVTIINLPDTKPTTVDNTVTPSTDIPCQQTSTITPANNEINETNNPMDDDFGYSSAEFKNSYFHIPTLSEFSKKFFTQTTKVKAENLTTVESETEKSTTTNRDTTELAVLKINNTSLHNKTKVAEKGGDRSYMEEIAPNITNNITRVKITGQYVQHKTFFTRLPSNLDENNAFLVVTEPDMKSDSTSTSSHVTLPATNRKREVTTREITLTPINQVFKNDTVEDTDQLIANNTVYESRTKRSLEDLDSSGIHTAKQVAALEVIVDLMKDTQSLVNNNINTHNVDAQKYSVGDGSVGGSTKRNVELASITKRSEPINNIQIHIAVPYNVGDRKRSISNTKIRKIFSANFSNPVDLEYQIHSLKETTTEESQTLSTGIYLVIQKEGAMLQKGMFTLKPILVHNSSKATTATSAVDNNSIEKNLVKNSQKVTLSNNLVSELLQLYQNINNTAKQNVKAKKSSKPKQNIVRQILNNMKSKQFKRNAKWNIFDKYFGDERVCNCKCRENHTMCKACVASDKVMSELIFEFDNLAKYMSDHCTEVQTFFYMNPSGGRKLKEVVHRIDRSLNDYYKRVKGKCHGTTCKMLCTCMDKRDTNVNTNSEEHIGYALLSHLEYVANDVLRVSKSKDYFDVDLFKAINDFKKVAFLCVPLSRTVRDARRERLFKNVYSSDNVMVNIICNTESSTQNLPITENHLQSSDDIFKNNLVLSTEPLQQFIDGFDVEDDIDYLKRKFKKKRKLKKNKHFKRDIYTLKPNADLTQNLGKATYIITTQIIQKSTDNETNITTELVAMNTRTIAKTLAPSVMSNLSKETNSIKNFNESGTEAEITKVEKNVTELNYNMTKSLDTFEHTSEVSIIEDTTASNLDGLLEEKPVETKKKAKKKKKKVKKVFKHKNHKKIHKVEKMKESSRNQASTIPEIPLPPLDTTDPSPTIPDTTGKSVPEIPLPPLDTSDPSSTIPDTKCKSVPEITLPPLDASDPSSTIPDTTAKSVPEIPLPPLDTSDPSSTIPDTKCKSVPEITLPPLDATDPFSTIPDTKCKSVPEMPLPPLDTTDLSSTIPDTTGKSVPEITLPPLDSSDPSSTIPEMTCKSVPETPLPPLDTTDQSPTIPDTTCKSKYEEILTSPLDTKKPTSPNVVTDEEVTKKKTLEATNKKATIKTPLTNSTVHGFFKTIMDFIHKLDKGNNVIDDKNSSTVKDKIIRINVPIYDNGFIVSLESKSDDSGYMTPMIEFVTGDNILNENIINTVDLPGDINKDKNENSFNDYETLLNFSNKIPMSRSAPHNGKDKSVQRDLLLSILKFETCEIKDELEKITDNNYSNNSVIDTLDNIFISKEEKKEEEPLQSLLGKVLEIFGMTNNQEYLNKKDVTNKENHSSKMRNNEKINKNLTEAVEVKGKPNGVCDLEATIQNVINEHRRMSNKDFRNYVKNIYCTSCKSIPEYFLIRSKRKGKKRRKNHKTSKYRRNRDGMKRRSLLSFDENLYLKDNEFDVEDTEANENCTVNSKKHKVIYNLFEALDTDSVTSNLKDFTTLKSNITRDNFNNLNTLVKEYKLNSSNLEDQSAKPTRSAISNSKTYGFITTSAPKLDILFEIFVKDSDGIYRINNRRKRDAGLINFTSKPNELPPLDPAKDEIYVVLNDSIIIHCNPRGEENTKYTWLTDRGDITDYSNVVVNGPTLCIEGVKADNVGHYECRAYGELERSVKLSVLDVPKYYVIFTPTYNGLQDCTYDDFKVLRHIGHEISELVCDGNHYCNVEVEEPSCLIDEDDKTAQVRTTVVITSHHTELRCSPQCRRDLEYSIALLSAGNAPPLSSIPVVISNGGVNKTLKPSVKFDLNGSSNTIIQSFKKRGTKQHEDYHEITSKMSPRDVAILVSCQGGFYLVSNQMICATCPENTYSDEGENVCRPCPKSGYSAPGSKKCRKICRLHRYDWLYPPFVQCIVGCFVFVCCTYTICIMFSYLTRDPTAKKPHNGVTDDNVSPGTSRNIANHARARPISPSHLILSKLFRRASSSSRRFHFETDSQETKLGLWKEKNVPPPLPPVDFDLISE